MSRKKQAPEEPVEETEEQPVEDGSKAAGVVLLLVLGGTGGAALFTVAPGAGVLSLWGAGVLLLFRAVARKKRVHDAPNPAPPAPSEGARNTFLQVIESARQDGSRVTEFPSGLITISKPDAVNPSRTHIKVIKTDSE